MTEIGIEEFTEWAQTTMRLFGQEKLFSARRKAMRNLSKTSVSTDGVLLGGRLEMTLTFDFEKERK